MILAIDPGRAKSGYALVDEDADSGGETGVAPYLAARGVVPTPEITAIWQAFAQAHPALTLVVGDGTGSGPVLEALRSAGADPHLIGEPFTTQQARGRYFAAYPPRGWRRLVPRGLLTPPVPVDDFAALILAENWIALRHAETGGG